MLKYWAVLGEDDQINSKQQYLAEGSLPSMADLDAQVAPDLEDED